MFKSAVNKNIEDFKTFWIHYDIERDSEDIYIFLHFSCHLCFINPKPE